MSCNGILSLHTLLSCSIFLTFYDLVCIGFVIFGAGFDGLAPFRLSSHAIWQILLLCI